MVLAVAVLPAAADAAQAKRTCASGSTVLLDGGIRVFATPLAGGGGVYDSDGWEYWACTVPKGAPVPVGGSSSGNGTASGDTPTIVSDGQRYLAAVSSEDGEGGPFGEVFGIDVKTRRSTAFANLSDPVDHSVRLGAAGALLHQDEDNGPIRIVARTGSGRTQVLTPLSSAGAYSTEVARLGATAYWTETPVPAAGAKTDPAAATAHSATLTGALPAGEDHVLSPVPTPRSRGACGRRKGATIAATPGVRVYARAGVRWACGSGDRAPVRLPPPLAGTSRTADLRIAGDRWVLATGGSRLLVADTRKATTATTAPAPRRGANATLLADGTAAWLDATGALVAQRAAAEAPVVLAPAAAVPAPPASSERTIYWTAGGVPQLRLATAVR